MLVSYKNFTGGEVTPTLSARYDLNKFGTFLACCENFIPNLHGDIERRPGTQYLATLPSLGYLIPFSFNSEAANNYVLVFTAAWIMVYNQYGVVQTTLNSPYELADVLSISYAQVGDILYLAHKDYALKKITRSGSSSNYTWAIQDVVLNQSISAPSITGVTWNRGPKSSDDTTPYTLNETYTLRYVVTAVDADGVESLGSNVGTVTARYPSDWVAGDYAMVNFSGVTGATEYNVYRESAGYYGFIGTTTGSSFQDENFTPDTSQTPKEDWNPFANANNPKTITFHQQRMVLCGTNDEPATIYMSRTGDFENFRKSYPLQDDDPIEYMIASGSIDDIQWAISFGDLLVGTSSCEYEVSSSAAAVTPSDVHITTQSFWGSATVRPLIIGNSIVHCERNGYHIRDLHYSWETDGYKGNDLSVLAPHLVDGYTLTQWAFQQSPGNNVWMVRSDGTLLCLTYMQEQNIFAWSRHTTKGTFISVATLSGTNEDVVIVVVKRRINGTDQYFLEKLGKRFAETDSLKFARYSDCYKYNAVATATTTFTGFTHLANTEVDVLADGSPEVHTISSTGTLTLNHTAQVVIVGLHYDSVLAPLPMESETQQGSSLGVNRNYGNVTLRVYRTVGGKYAASNEGDYFTTDAWKDRKFFDIPFLPEYYDNPVNPFSGDLDIMLPSGRDPDCIIWVKQDKPLPFRLISIMAEINF